MQRDSAYSDRMAVTSDPSVGGFGYGRAAASWLVSGGSCRGGGLVRTCVKTGSSIALVHGAFVKNNPVDVGDGLMSDGSRDGQSRVGRYPASPTRWWVVRSLCDFALQSSGWSIWPFRLHL